MKKIIVANWKMNPQTLAEAKELFQEVKKRISPTSKSEAEVVICPPFVYLGGLGSSARGGPAVGSQDCFWEDKGAYTGEISPLMLKSIGAKYVVIGHSDRRENLAETDEMINKKILAALKKDLKVVLCVGEKRRKRGELPVIVEEELLKGLRRVSKKYAQNLNIVYEPIWAIGTGKIVKPEDLFEVVVYIREVLSRIFGKIIAHKIPILYGGSVNRKNSKSFLEVRGISGLLIGGASLDAKEFSDIVNAC